jgi:hypothetical protein
MFSGLYQKDSDKLDASGGALARRDATDGAVATASRGGIGADALGSIASNRSSSAYESQLMPGAADANVEMEALSKMGDRSREKRWAPKPSKQREMNLFAPCST